MGSANPVQKRKTRESLEVTPLPSAISQPEALLQTPRGWWKGLWSVLNTVVLSKWNNHPHNGRLPARQGDTGCRNTLIIGADESGRVLAEYLDTNPNLGYVVKGFVDPDSHTNPRLLGKLTDLPTIVQQHVIDHVFVSTAWEKKELRTILEQAHKQRFAVKLFPRTFVAAPSSSDGAEFGKFTDSILRDRSGSNVQCVLKRTMDLLLASLLLVIVLPLMIVVAIFIKAESCGPVLYRSWRVGKNGRHFLCYKFRTMVSNAHELKEKLLYLNERHRPLFKIAKDPRVTRVGRSLRKYSIDELPQLWNVFRGDMTLVGPRPALSEELCEYRMDHLRRFAVSPGLTGLWQVSARSDPSFLTYMNLDLYYVDHWSLWLDMIIVLRTIPAVLRGEGR